MSSNYVKNALGETFEYNEKSGQYKLVSTPSTVKVANARPSAGGSYTIATKDRQYTLNQSTIDWIRNRYKSTFGSYYGADDEDQTNRAMGAMPRSFTNSYKNNGVDAQLYSMGLPSSKYLDSYVADYQAWYGDGQVFTFDDEQAKDVAADWKRSWKYSNSAEDLQRKLNGIMPVAEEAKYKDKNGNFKSYADEMYFNNSKGSLPPSSEIGGFVGNYLDFKNKEAREEEAYIALANKFLGLELEGIKNDNTLYTQEDGTQVTGRSIYERVFVDTLGESEWDDVRSWVKPDVAASSFIPDPSKTDLQNAEDEWAYNEKQKAKLAAEDDPYFIDPNFDAAYDFYEKNRETLRTRKVAEDTASGLWEGTELSYGDIADAAYTDKVNEMYAAITDETTLNKFLNTRDAKTTPDQIITELKKHGVKKKLVKAARDALLGKTEDEATREAINAAFKAPTIVDASAVDSTRPKWMDSAQKILQGGRGDKSARDKVFDKKTKEIGSALNSLFESEEFSQKAVDAFNATLEFDDNGRVTLESAERGLDAALAAGASPKVIRQLLDGVDRDMVRESDGVVVVGTSALHSHAMDVIEQAEARTIKEFLPAFRSSLSAQGAGEFEIDQALRRAGYGEYLDEASAAQNYFIEVGYMNDLEAVAKDNPELQTRYEELKAASAEERRAIASAAWESMTDAERADMIAGFAETQMVNPEIHKNLGDSIKDYLGGRFLGNLFLDIASGAVNAADAITGIGSDREQWEISKTLSETLQWSKAYGKSSTQGGGMGAFNLATTVSDELLRMATLSKIGGAMAQAANQISSKIAPLARIVSTHADDAAYYANLAESASGTAGKIYWVANQKFSQGIANIVSGSFLSGTPFVANAMGNYFNEAMASGATRRDATVYAVICGGLEGAIEKFNVDMWVSKGLGSKRLAKTIIEGQKSFSRASLNTKAVAIHLIASALGEGIEESVSYAASYDWQRRTYNPNAEFSWGEFFESGGMGALIGIVGAAGHAGSYNASNILYEGMKNGGYSADFFDLLHASVQVESMETDKFKHYSESVQLLPLAEYKAAQNDIAAHSRQLDEAAKSYESERNRINSELQLKTEAVARLEAQALALKDAPMSVETATELGKVMNALAVADSELKAERAQAEDKLTKLQNSYTENTSQHRIALEKAQARLDAHNVSLYNMFLPDIARMRGLTTAQIQRNTAAQQEQGAQSVLSRAYQSGNIDAATLDAMDAASEELVMANQLIAQADDVLARGQAAADSIREKMRSVRGKPKQAYNSQKESNAMPTQTAEDAPSPQAEQTPVEQPTEQAQQPTAEQEQQPVTEAPQYIELNDDDVVTISEAASKVNRTVVVENMREDISGYYDGDGVLHINRKQPAKYGDHPAFVVFVHELTHSLETSPRYYHSLKGLVFDYARKSYKPDRFATFEEHYNAFAEDVRRDRAALGEETTDDIIEREFVARFAEDHLFTDEAAIKALAAQNSSWFARTLNQIRYWLYSKGIAGSGTRAEQDLKQIERLYAMALHDAGVKPSDDIREFMLNNSEDYIQLSKEQVDKLSAELYVYLQETIGAAETSVHTDRFRAIVSAAANGRLEKTNVLGDGVLVFDKDGSYKYVTNKTKEGEFYNYANASRNVFDGRDDAGRNIKEGSGSTDVRYRRRKHFRGSGSDIQGGEADSPVSNEGDNRGLLLGENQKQISFWESYLELGNEDAELTSSYDANGEVLSVGQKDYFDEYGFRNEEGLLLPLYRSAGGTKWDSIIYLTDNMDVAHAFAFNGKRYGDVLAVYARAQNPFVIDAKGNSYINIPVPDNAPQWLTDRASYNTETKYDEQLGTYSVEETWSIDADRLPVYAFENGYDAVVIKNVREGVGGPPSTDYILKDSNQMKWTGNRNPTTNPDIQFSTGTSWSEAGNRYGAHAQGMNPRAREVAVPVSSDGTDRTSLFLRNALESSNVSDETLQEVVTAFEREQFGTYNPQSNSVLLDKARNYIAKTGGITKALESFHNDAKAGKHSSLNTAIGMQLLAEMKDDPAASLDIIADLCVMATESGRSTQSFAMLKKLGGVGSAYYMKRLESRFNEKYKKQIANGDMDGFHIPDDIMQKLIDAKSAYEIEAAEEAVAKYLGEAMPLSFAERMQNWRYFAMLSNPATHFRNVLGNALMMSANAGKNVIATGLERAFVSKDKRTHAIYNPANQRERIAAAEQAFRDNHKDITAAGGKYGFDQEVTKHKRLANSDVLNAAMKLNTKALEVEDNFFLHSGYVNAYTQFLVARDIDPANMTRQQKADAHEWATKQAKEITFRDASVIADTLNSIANKGIVAKVLVEGAIPFKKTPVNIAARAIEYSPAGLAKTIYKATAGVKNGTSTTADAIDHLSRNIAGTGVLALGYFLAKLGVLRGNGDDDEKVETFKLATGDKNYSFTFGDKVIEASGIAPMNIPMFMGAALFEATEGSGVDFTLSDLSTLLTEITNPLMEMSFLSSLNSVLSSYSSDGFGGNLGNMAWQATKNYASQYIPAPVAKTADVIDRVERSTAGDPTTALGKSESKYERSLRAKIPFLSQTLEPKIDIHGDKNVRYGFGELAMEIANAYILPAKVTTKNRNAVDESLLSLYRTTGRTDIFPAVPKNNKFTHNHKSYQMNAKQFTQYSIDLGNETYAAIKSVMSSPSWSKLDDAAKADIIADTIGNTKEAMRVKYLDILGAYDN